MAVHGDVLGPSDRVKITNIAAEFVIKEFGWLPKTEEYQQVAKTLVFLWPCFKVPDSADGIVSSF